MKKLITTRDFYLTSDMRDNIMPSADLPLYKILLELVAKPKIDYEFTLEVTYSCKEGDDFRSYFDFFPPIKSKLMLAGMPDIIVKDEILIMMVKWHDDIEVIKKKEPLIFDLNLYEIDEEERMKA